MEVSSKLTEWEVNFLCPYFLPFGLNTERVSLHIQSECGKIRTIKFPNTDTFRAVNCWKYCARPEN